MALERGIEPDEVVDEFPTRERMWRGRPAAVGAEGGAAALPPLARKAARSIVVTSPAVEATKPAAAKPVSAAINSLAV